MLNIVIGTEENQYIPQQVLIYSLYKTASEELNIVMPAQEFERRGGTNFGFVRFLVPQVFNYIGKALYIDADQIVFEDIKNIFDELEASKSLCCVQEPDGNFGGKIVQRGNQTSVMVLNCEKLRNWDPDTIFENVVPNRAELSPGQIHYRDFMMLTWMDQEEIGELSPEWNHFNIFNKKTKLTHFSHVRSQPWKNINHDLVPLWIQWLEETIKDGYLEKGEVIEAVKKEHIDPYYLKVT